MLFTEMLAGVPTSYPQDPSGGAEIEDLPTLFATLSYIVTNPIMYEINTPNPAWGPTNAQIGTPINAILCWPMATKAGLAAFLDTRVNAKLQAILNDWGNYLQGNSPYPELTPLASNFTVTTDEGGWLNKDTTIKSYGLQNFKSTYTLPDPEDTIHWGFQSWDEFFTRKFKNIETTRPLGQADITSAAESEPFAIKTKVKLYDSFWIKGQPYSLAHMLNGEDQAKQFVDGTVYQAFLSADNYHCWHAPITGTVIEDPQLIPGTYYSEPLINGFSPDSGPSNPDPGADAASQGYISSIAARGLLLVEAADSRLGTVAIPMIGMAEVSSVDFMGLKKGETITQGEQMGMFHFGGSTHCLIFGPNVNLDFGVAKPNAGGYIEVRSRWQTLRLLCKFVNLGIRMSGSIEPK